MGDRGGLAYEVKSTKRPDGQYRPAAHVQCRGHGCSATTELAMSNTLNNPEWVGKEIRARGWAFDAFHAGETRCPRCLARQQRKRRGESPGPKSNGATILTMTPSRDAPPGAAAPAPQPTTDQRAAIRRALEETFDDKVGCYLDGNSDQAIGARLGLPWIMVRTIREAAYGPIKSVPELDALRTEQATLLDRAARIATEAKSIEGQAHSLGERIDAIARKFGIEAAA